MKYHREEYLAMPEYHQPVSYTQDVYKRQAADTIASQIETIVHSHEPDVEVSEIVQESYIPVSYTHLSRRNGYLYHASLCIAF